MIDVAPKVVTAAAPRPRCAATVALLATYVVAQGVAASEWTDRTGFRDRPFATSTGWLRLDALRMRRGLEEGGFDGWFAAGARHDRPEPPLVPMLVGLASAIEGGEGISHDAALSVTLVFGALLVVGAYGIGRAFFGPRGALASALLAASAPAFLAQLRGPGAALPGAAATAAALAVLLASRGFARLDLSLGFGLAAGTAALLHSHAPIALLPPAAGAFAYGLRGGAPLRRVLGGAVLAALAAGVVAGPWYAHHRESVTANFLRAFAGGEHDLTTAEILLRAAAQPLRLVNEGTGWIVGIVACAALASATVKGRRGVREGGVVLGLAALGGFLPAADPSLAAETPLLLACLPSAAVAAVAGVARAASPGARRALAALLAGAALLAQALATCAPDATPSPWLAPTPPTHAGPDGSTGVPETLADLARRAATATAPEVPRLAPLPDVHRRRAAELAEVGARAERPPESWPVAAFIERMYRNPYLVRPHVAQSTPSARTHPFFERFQTAYEAELRGRSFGLMSYEDVFARNDDGYVVLGSMNYVLVDLRPEAGLLSESEILDGLARNDTEQGVVLRTEPRAAAGIALIEIKRRGVVEGPRPASDLDAPGARRLRARFANGWTLLGAQVVVCGDGQPMLHLWFDGLAPGPKPTGIWTNLLVDGETESAAIPETLPPPDCDATRPLIAITMHGFRPPTRPGARAFAVKLTAKGERSVRVALPVEASDLGTRGDAAALIPWDDSPQPPGRGEPRAASRRSGRGR